MSSPMRIIFAGTPEFAVYGLKALVESGYNVCAVYTQPDRPAGRGRQLQASPVKQYAQENNIPVYQPLNFKSETDVAQLKSLDADLMVVIAYGLLLPKSVLEVPKLGCINVHASLLPRWRGAAPINRSILHGDKETGVTIMQMDQGLDTGDMLYKVCCPISETDTAGSIHDKLAQLGADALLETISRIVNQTITPEKQDDRQACYAKKMTKEESVIDWSNSALQISQQIRGFNPWPVAQTTFNGKVMRVWMGNVVAQQRSGHVAGEVVSVGQEGFDVMTGDGVIQITKVQMPGKKPVDANDFTNANKVIGVVLGG